MKGGLSSPPFILFFEKPSFAVSIGLQKSLFQEHIAYSVLRRIKIRNTQSEIRESIYLDTYN
jgi:hypothetical protein